MSNANKQKGTRWESAVRDYFNSTGQAAHRIAQAGDDEGDVHVNGAWCIQCKDVAKPQYAKWVDDVEDQRLAAGLRFGAVIHKKRNAPVGDALVVMTLDQFSELTNRLRIAEMVMKGNSDGYAGA